MGIVEDTFNKYQLAGLDSYIRKAKTTAPCQRTLEILEELGIIEIGLFAEYMPKTQWEANELLLERYNLTPRFIYETLN